MQALLAVAVGGAAGSAARYLMVVGCGRLCGSAFPWGVFAVNVLGSLLMGVFVALFVRTGAMAESTRLLLTTGLLGGFTTFSSFSLDAILLAERGAWGAFAAYVLGSVALSLGGLVLGMRMVQWAA